MRWACSSHISFRQLNLRQNAAKFIQYAMWDGFTTFCWLVYAHSNCKVKHEGNIYFFISWMHKHTYRSQISNKKARAQKIPLQWAVAYFCCWPFTAVVFLVRAENIFGPVDRQENSKQFTTRWKYSHSYVLLMA